MTTYREEEDLFEEEVVFDQSGLLNNSNKVRTAIRRISSGKCALFAKTLGLCGAFFGLGLCIAIPGPTLLSPVLALHTGVSPISSIYAARSSGYLIGSIMGGFLFDHFNRLFLLFISLLVTSVFITIVPWCQVFWLLETCMVVLGISMGFLDTGGNVLCLDLWGRNSGPFMQALHFSFGLGAFVAPLLVAPFLGPNLMNNLTSDSLVVNTTHPVYLHEIHSFGTDTTGTTARLKRDISNITDLNHAAMIMEDNVTKIFTDLQDISDNNTKTTATSLFSLFMEDLTPTSTATFKTTRRSPKPKPSKIDGRKLGDENWDRIPVGKPPMADLIPLSTTVITTLQTTTSQVASTTLSTPYESQTPLQAAFLLVSSSISPSTKTMSVNDSESKFKTDTLNKLSIKSSDASETLSPSNVPTDVEAIVHNSTTFLPDLSSYSTGIGRFMEGELLQPTAFGARFPINTDRVDKLQPYSEIAREMDEDSEDYMMSYRNKHLEMPEGGNQLTTPLPNKIEQTLFNVYGKTFESSVDETSTAPSTTIEPSKHVHHFKPGTYDNDTEDIDSFLNVFANKIEKYGLSKAQFTYLIVGLFIFLISLVFLGFLCHNPRDPKSKQEEGQGTKVPNKTLSNTLVVFMAIFLLLFVGLELTFGQLVVVFAMHSDLKLSQATGTVIAAAFWGSFAAMRFASIFFASGLSPFLMLAFNLILCTVGTVLLSALANGTESALWAGTVLVGIGLASVFPTSILWMERYIHVSNKVAAVLVVGVSLGEMICPIMIYQLMVINPSMLMHASLVINFLCILIFLIMYWLTSKLGEKYCVVNSNGYQLANQNEEEEDMIEMSPSDSRLSLSRHNLSAERRSLLNGSLH